MSGGGGEESFSSDAAFYMQQSEETNFDKNFSSLLKKQKMSDISNSNRFFVFDNDNAVSSVGNEGFEIVHGKQSDRDRWRVTKKGKKISVTLGDLRKTTSLTSVPVPSEAQKLWNHM